MSASHFRTWVFALATLPMGALAKAPAPTRPISDIDDSSGTIKLECVPRCQKIFLDGKLIVDHAGAPVPSGASIELEVGAGEHRIGGINTYFKVGKQTRPLTIAQGEKREVTLILK